MNLFGYDTEKRFDYENGFYLTSDITRLAKIISHYELYKMIKDLPGHIVECGVFKGASFIRWATFRDILENTYSRRIIGFDIFGEFPETAFEPDKPIRQKFIDEAGNLSISEEEFKDVLVYKNFRNYELIKGDINQTIPKYVRENPQLKISLLHIDTDIYEPAKTALEHLYDKIVKGGIVVFDDYGTFPGETKAVDDFFAGTSFKIRKFTFSHHIPSYIIKE
jgi:hypothetical protein